MDEKIDFYKIDNLLEEHSVEEVIQYKNKFIPKKLYKYNLLLDEKYLDFELENNKRLNSLECNTIWLSNHKAFNDPFEFEMLAIDKERLKNTNWNIKDVEEQIDIFKERTLVSCFSSKVDNNMPMWAHYANNHKGYCVEYLVEEPNMIFPVSYEGKRTKSAVILTNLVSEIYKSFQRKLTEPTEKFYKYFLYLYFSLCCKNNFWEYENEYRLLYCDLDKQITSGKRININKVGLKVESIYVGLKCEEQYAKRIIKIGNKINCNVYKMEFDKYGEDFGLIPKKIR
ncbi:DUF2971 domain-containing protein [Clostridium saccharobutylicum]|uniref:DUF2971 domain-containing protein n=1 Tax=Clostridium saccharobutylicum TaxID=169679 RepID=A0A1S8MYF4_CLOSA|nr:DUF2971 domain-containing protein [Clostridium saccharobutylicum]OOM09111.1 hypothetical protein CLOSAC_33910 [Clostridium saccharobutylicum]